MINLWIDDLSQFLGSTYKRFKPKVVLVAVASDLDGG